jgi:hypothetical protein
MPHACRGGLLPCQWRSCHISPRSVVLRGLIRLYADRSLDARLLARSTWSVDFPGHFHGITRDHAIRDYFRVYFRVYFRLLIQQRRGRITPRLSTYGGVLGVHEYSRLPTMRVGCRTSVRHLLEDEVPMRLSIMFSMRVRECAMRLHPSSSWIHGQCDRGRGFFWLKGRQELHIK